MAGRQESLRGEIPISELMAEEHADDGGNREGAEDPGLFRCGEAEAGQIAEDQRQPRAPDEELQHHHQEQLRADRCIHARAMTSSRNSRLARAFAIVASAVAPTLQHSTMTGPSKPAAFSVAKTAAKSTLPVPNCTIQSPLGPPQSFA